MTNSNITIILIDDEVAILRILSSFLEDHDYNVFSYTTGNDAIMQQDSTKADVAIVDMRMDGLNGEETMLELFKVNPDIKFIVHTGSSEYYLNDNLKNLGVTEEYFFKKPVLNMQDFIIAINKLISGDKNES